jgi:hypothetical protein
LYGGKLEVEVPCMIHADGAKVEWNPAKKHWEVHILVGAETIKRPIPKKIAENGEAALKQQALATARDEGYDVNPEQVALIETEDHAA